MDKSQISIATLFIAGVTSIYLMGNNHKNLSFSSETWAPGESLPPSVMSLIKEYIESGENPKGIGSLMPKILNMVNVESKNKGKLIGELNKEARNYSAGAPIDRRKKS